MWHLFLVYNFILLGKAFPSLFHDEYIPGSIATYALYGCHILGLYKWARHCWYEKCMTIDSEERCASYSSPQTSPRRAEIFHFAGTEPLSMSLFRFSKPWVISSLSLGHINTSCVLSTIATFSKHASCAWMKNGPFAAIIPTHGFQLGGRVASMVIFVPFSRV